jgi:hypothetical protein
MITAESDRGRRAPMPFQTELRRSRWRHLWLKPPNSVIHGVKPRPSGPSLIPVDR